MIETSAADEKADLRVSQNRIMFTSIGFDTVLSIVLIAGLGFSRKVINESQVVKSRYNGDCGLVSASDFCLTFLQITGGFILALVGFCEKDPATKAVAPLVSQMFYSAHNELSKSEIDENYAAAREAGPAGEAGVERNYCC